MRIYVGGISTETNTFSPILMEIAQFKKACWIVGKEVEQVKTTSKEMIIWKRRKMWRLFPVL